MNTKAFLSCVLLVSAIGFSDQLLAQAPKVEFPAPSPTCTIKQRVGLTDFEITYSRPGVKGRQIFGGLIPYGEVWRTGANSATKVVASTPFKINGAEVPAGTYGLFTIPGPDEWTIILSKVSQQWGAYRYDQKDDVVRVKTKAVPFSELVETFTVEFDAIRDESARIDLVWEKTLVPINIEVDVASKLGPQIESVMASDAKDKPYYQAAMWYYDHNLDLKKASKWVDSAIQQREAFYIVHLKAKILAKLGDKEGAIAAAKRSTELAKEAKDSGYVKLNQDLIASLK